jgi:hypothetical protein
MTIYVFRYININLFNKKKKKLISSFEESIKLLRKNNNFNINTKNLRNELKYANNIKKRL